MSIYKTSSTSVWTSGIFMFTLSFWMRHQLDASLFYSFLALYSTMVFPYSVFIALVPYIILVVRHANFDVTYPNYFMSVYMFFSVLEWFVHRYVMHAHIFFPLLTRTKGYFKTTCDRHQFHHGATNDDMSLQKMENPFEVILSWNTVIMFVFTSVAFFATVFPQIPLYIHVLTSLSTSLMWGYAWNTLHTDLHGYKEMRIGFTEGPRQLPFQFPEILYKNHILHHNVKGLQKGNFNIVFLGADYLFGTNWQYI